MSTINRNLIIALGCSLAFVSTGASAHAFAMPYTLPVPFWMYAYGAGAALAISFVVVGFFVGAPAGRAVPSVVPVARSAPAPKIGGLPASVARATSVFMLLLMIATGLFGSQNSFTNLNMTLFWIIFVLGYTYLTALIGDFYALSNPWRVLCEWIERIQPRAFRVRFSYPGWLGYYPAVALYMAFIWIELFADTQPASLAQILIGYTILNFMCAALVGKDRWFHYGELFAVFFRLIGKMAPFCREIGAAGAGDSIRLRPPFIGLTERRAEHMSLALFVLFMLSSTAFDGLKDTAAWTAVFWKGVYPFLDPFVQAASEQPYALSAQLYYIWQWLSLFLSAFVYLGVYLLFISLVKMCARSERSVRELALAFAFSLIPIAFVYNLTHYFVLLFSQGVQIFSLASDPFGVGWDLFGTAKTKIEPLILDASFIWHFQVGMILVGHVISVYLAHVEALKIFTTPRRAVLSQLPMLILMVFLTASGLWIMSLPLGGG